MFRLSIVMAQRSRFSGTRIKAVRNAISIILTGLSLVLFVVSGTAWSDQRTTGKALVMEKGKGNCLACHIVADGKLAGNIGPPLVGMKARFPDSESLYRQIWDATEKNPDSRMPPFGRHGILSSEEIHLIVEYLYTL